MRLLPAAFVLFLAAQLGRPGALRAEDAEASGDAKARAKKFFEEGQQHYNQGAYAKAIEAFRKAQKIKPHPVIVYNIALTYAMLRKYVDAVRHLQKYLKVQPDAGKTLPWRLKYARKKVGLLAVEAPDPKVEIYVDGRLRGKGRVHVVVWPGRRTVDVRKGDRVLLQREVSVPAGGEKSIVLASIPRLKKPRKKRKPGPSWFARLKKRRKLHWAYFAAAAGVTAAALFASVGTSAKTKQLHDDYMNDRSNVSLYNEGRRYRSAATAMWAATAVFAVGAATVALFTRFRRKEREKTPASFNVGPGSVGVTVHFTGP